MVGRDLGAPGVPGAPGSGGGGEGAAPSLGFVPLGLPYRDTVSQTSFQHCTLSGDARFLAAVPDSSRSTSRNGVFLWRYLDNGQRRLLEVVPGPGRTLAHGVAVCAWHPVHPELAALTADGAVVVFAQARFVFVVFHHQLHTDVSITN